jgi:cellulose synthase/poly-beta-1,6-N-acetylglucosamine synthase-like glycosyltransferase
MTVLTLITTPSSLTALETRMQTFEPAAVGQDLKMVDDNSGPGRIPSVQPAAGSAISVIIPTRNEEDYLPFLLESLKFQTVADRLEVIVSDADSTDRTPAIAAARGCKIVAGGHPAFGRNAGAAVSNGDVLVFIDADIVLPHRRYLETAVDEFERRQLDVAGTLQDPIIDPKENKAYAWFFRKFYAIANLAMLRFQTTRHPCMQSLMLAGAEAFRAIGGYPLYEFGEDSGLAKQAVAANYQFGILRDCGRSRISARRIKREGKIKYALIVSLFNLTRLLGHEFKVGESRFRYFTT